MDATTAPTPAAALASALHMARALQDRAADIHRLQDSAIAAETADAAALAREEKRETPDPKKLEVLRVKQCGAPAEHERLAREAGATLLLIPATIMELQTTAAPVRLAAMLSLRHHAVRAIGPLLEGPTVETQQRNAAGVPGLSECTLESIVGKIVFGSEFAARLRCLEQEASHLSAGDHAALCLAVKWAERCLAVHRDWEAFLASHDRAAT